MKKLIATLVLAVCLLLPLSVNAYSASAYTVIERSSGRVLYSSNGDARMPMASTTKVMTALLVIKNLELDREYEIPDAAVGIEGSSIYLARGERLTGRELLYGLMLASGNDAAYALAILTSGSVEKFVALMNDTAQELDLKNTHFADPCGLKYKEHYTTSNDLARLCAVALSDETFAEVVATQNFQIRGSREGTVRYLHNKNRILGEFLGGNGIKTGYTTAAGRCLCSSATRNGMQLVCVVLNDHDWFADSEKLLEKGFEEYGLVRLSQKNKFAGTCNILGGKSEKCDIIQKDDVFYPMKKSEYAESITEITLCKRAPVQAGEVAGSTEFFLNGTKIAETDCVFATDVQKKFSLFGK